MTPLKSPWFLAWIEDLTAQPASVEPGAAVRETLPIGGPPGS